MDKEFTIGIKILAVLSFTLMLAVSSMKAQETEWESLGEGEIEDASFVVEKSLEIELPQKNRKFEKVPPLPARSPSTPSLGYNYMSIMPEVSTLSIPNRALKLKSQPLEKFYGGNVSAGFGNYVTPYLDASLFNKRENNYALGFNFQHMSSRNGPVDKENSGSSDTRAAFESKYYGRKVTIGGDLDYKRQMVHYFGYPDGTEVGADSIKQVYNAYGVGLWFGNTDKKDDFDYRIDAEYNHIRGKFDSRESRTEVALQSNYFLREGLKFYLDVYTMFSSYTYEESLSRNLIKVKPYMYYRYADFDIRGGLNFVFQNDTLSGRGDVLLFPFIRVDYVLNDYLGFYLKLDGDMEQVDLQSVINENPYIDQEQALLHSNRRFGIEWGVNGNLNNSFSYLAGFRLADYIDLYFFQNDSLDISRFNILYDHDNTNVFNAFGELVYSKVENYSVGIRADYFKYSTKSLAEAWHRPSYKVTGTFRYNIYDKIVFGSNIYLLGGIMAYDFNAAEAIKLKAVVDLNLSVDYLFSERLGVFLRFDNIIGQNYELYWRYPSRGIQVLGGITVSF